MIEVGSAGGLVLDLDRHSRHPWRANLDHAALTDLIVLNRKLDDVAAPDMAGVTKHVLANCQLPLVLAH